LGVSQNESVHPQLESQPSQDENPESQQTLGKNVDPFMLHIYAAIAQQERELISRRTREALAAAQERGVRLGRQEIADAQRAAAATRDAILEPVLPSRVNLGCGSRAR
jgi:DNA invertase Pin-like site-specific DNA recombinase